MDILRDVSGITGVALTIRIMTFVSFPQYSILSPSAIENRIKFGLSRLGHLEYLI
jgi:hypothetical protein